MTTCNEGQCGIETVKYALYLYFKWNVIIGESSEL